MAEGSGEEAPAWLLDDDEEAERITAGMADIDWEDEEAVRDALYHDPKRALKDYLFTPDMLDLIPPVQWIIDSVLPLDALAVLYADAGAGKTFIALDWCASLSAGFPDWQGYALRPDTKILYIYAEGGPGLRKRRDAWQAHHSVKMGMGLTFLLRGLNFLVKPNDTGDDEWSQLKEIVEQLSPALIVVDTMSRAIPGGDENDQATMSFLMARADDLRELAGWGTVLFLHHTNRSGSGYRGSSVIRGQVHTMIELNEDSILRVDKQRDDEEVTIGRMSLHPVEGSDSVVPVFEVVDAGPDDATVRRYQALTYIRQAPGSSTNAVRKALGNGNPDTIKALLAQLEAEGAIRSGAIPRGLGWWAMEQVPDV